jgi:hypothetical protein
MFGRALPFGKHMCFAVRVCSSFRVMQMSSDPHLFAPLPGSAGSLTASLRKTGAHQCPSSAAGLASSLFSFFCQATLVRWQQTHAKPVLISARLAQQRWHPHSFPFFVRQRWFAGSKLTKTSAHQCSFI